MVLLGMCSLFFLVVFPFSVARSGPLINSERLASSAVIGQLLIILCARIRWKKISEGLPTSFRYSSLASSAPSISRRVNINLFFVDYGRV